MTKRQAVLPSNIRLSAYFDFIWLTVYLMHVGKQRLANKSITSLCLQAQRQIAYSWIQFNFGVKRNIASQIGGNITMKCHAYSWINTKFRIHLRRVHSGHYSDNYAKCCLGMRFLPKSGRLQTLVWIGYELIPKTSFWFLEWESHSSLLQLCDIDMRGALAASINNWWSIIDSYNWSISYQQDVRSVANSSSNLGWKAL